jgi:hypothetical protein
MIGTGKKRAASAPRRKTKKRAAVSARRSKKFTTANSNGVAVGDPESCPGAKKGLGQVVDIEKIASVIAEGWGKSAEAILEVAKVCAEASKTLSADDIRKLRARLPFDATVFSKLVAIGRCPHLNRPEVTRTIPPNWTTLRLLADLTPAELGAAISAEAKRRDLKSWIDRNSLSGQARASRPRVGASQRIENTNEGEFDDSDEIAFGRLKDCWRSSGKLLDQWRNASPKIRNNFVEYILLPEKRGQRVHCPFGGKIYFPNSPFYDSVGSK